MEIRNRGGCLRVAQLLLPAGPLSPLGALCRLAAGAFQNTYGAVSRAPPAGDVLFSRVSWAGAVPRWRNDVHSGGRGRITSTCRGIGVGCRVFRHDGVGVHVRRRLRGPLLAL
jgi:hypothetical protein